MASFVSGLIYDILPFKQQYKSVTSDTSNQYVDRKGAAAALVYDTNTITALPYDRSAYTQFIDKILDTTASKSNQEQVNRQSIMQGIKLVGIAVDEFDSGNEGIALDIYLSGLDKMIMSLPNLKERKTKLALKDKLLSLENRVGITAKHQQLSIQDIEQMDDPAQVKDHLISKFTTLSKILAPASWSTKDCEEKNRVHVANEELEGDPLSKFKRLGMLITDIVIQFAILFKQSPLPGKQKVVYFVTNHLMCLNHRLDLFYNGLLSTIDIVI